MRGEIKICYHFKRFDLVGAVIIQFPNDTSQSAKCARILRPFRSNYLNAHSLTNREWKVKMYIKLSVEREKNNI